MTVGTIIAIFIVGFLSLFAAYRYGDRWPVVQYVTYAIVILVFLVVLLNLAGILPANFLNRRV